GWLAGTAFVAVERVGGHKGKHCIGFGRLVLGLHLVTEGAVHALLALAALALAALTLTLAAIGRLRALAFAMCRLAVLALLAFVLTVLVVALFSRDSAWPWAAAFGALGAGRGSTGWLASRLGSDGGRHCGLLSL